MLHCHQTVTKAFGSTVQDDWRPSSVARCLRRLSAYPRLRLRGLRCSTCETRLPSCGADHHRDILPRADQVAYGRPAQVVDDEPFISVPDVCCFAGLLHALAAADRLSRYATLGAKIRGIDDPACLWLNGL